MSSVELGRWRVGEGRSYGTRATPEETPVAFVLNGEAVAVMLATPNDLEDFAHGFFAADGVSLEGPVEIVRSALGVEVSCSSQGGTGRTWTRPAPTGCGLCGIRALADVHRELPRWHGKGPRVSMAQLRGAMNELSKEQASAGVHAAGWWVPDSGLGLVREDVGRHNAVDKLFGALLRAEVDPLTGCLLLTSRVSVELIQKAATFGATVVAAISTPTALAVQTAESAGITLAGVVRSDAGEVFSHGERLEELA